MRGIDVSENNGTVNWSDVAAAGYDFAIIRLGYGRQHLDGEFYNNVNGAISAGLKIGVYYYSYAITQQDAEDEADFIVNTLDNCGLTPEKLPMGVWIDEEDADGWRAAHGLWAGFDDRQTVTDMVTGVVNKLWDAGYLAGVYCNLDWLEHYIDMAQTGGAGLWISNPGASRPPVECYIWQHTFSENINGHEFDGDIAVKEEEFV